MFDMEVGEGRVGNRGASEKASFWVNSSNNAASCQWSVSSMQRFKGSCVDPERVRRARPRDSGAVEMMTIMEIGAPRVLVVVFFILIGFQKDRN